MAKNYDYEDIVARLEKIEEILSEKSKKDDALEAFFKAAASKQDSAAPQSDKQQYEFIVRDTHGNLHMPARMSENDIMKFVYDACC